MHATSPDTHPLEYVQYVPMMVTISELCCTRAMLSRAVQASARNAPSDAVPRTNHGVTAVIYIRD